MDACGVAAEMGWKTRSLGMKPVCREVVYTDSESAYCHGSGTGGRGVFGAKASGNEGKLQQQGAERRLHPPRGSGVGECRRQKPHLGGHQGKLGLGGRCEFELEQRRGGQEGFC